MCFSFWKISLEKAYETILIIVFFYVLMFVVQLKLSNIFQKKKLYFMQWNCFACVAVMQEKVHQNLISGVEGFNKAAMKHTLTQEKNILPDPEGKINTIKK